MRGSLIIRDSDKNGDAISDFGFHSEMAELIFLLFWNGNGNRKLAISWAIAFIRDHQEIKM